MGLRGTRSEYATHAGVAPSYVTKLGKAGRLVLVKGEGNRELVDFELTDRLVRNTADLGRARNGRNQKATSPETTSPPVAPGYYDHKARQAAADAERAELETAVLARRLVDREQAERATFDAFRALRDAVFAACRSAAPMAIGLTEVREVQQLLDDGMRSAFAQFESQMAQQLQDRATA